MYSTDLDCTMTSLNEPIGLLNYRLINLISQCSDKFIIIMTHVVMVQISYIQLGVWLRTAWCMVKYSLVYG